MNHNKASLLGAWIVTLILSGCSSSPAELPEPSGLQVQVNTQIYPVERRSTIAAPATNKNKPFLVASSNAASQHELTTQIGDKIAALTGDDFSKLSSVKNKAVENSTSNKVKTTPSSVTPLASPQPTKLTIGAGETIDMALTRWGGSIGKVNVIYDVSPEIRAALEQRRDETKLYEVSFQASVAKLSEEFAQRSPKLRFWVSQTNSELIVHDIGPRTDVRSFYINQPTLRDAAFALVKELGWNVLQGDGYGLPGQDSWTSKTPNYNLSAPYKMVVSGDVIRTMRKLFTGYNVQAQFEKSTKTVYFVQRNKT